MNLLLFLGLVTCLLASVFWIIPKYASEKDQEIIKDWLGIGFAGLLLIITLIETRAQDTTLVIPIVLYLLVLIICLSGIYWWIPTYIAKPEQSKAISLMFLVVNLALILTNSLNPTPKPTFGARRK
jgi:hypothetical protein